MTPPFAVLRVLARILAVPGEIRGTVRGTMAGGRDKSADPRVGYRAVVVDVFAATTSMPCASQPPNALFSLNFTVATAYGRLGTAP
jgi:hypothetical protein